MTAVEDTGDRAAAASAVRSLPLLAAFLRRDFGVARSYRLPFTMDLASTVLMLVLFYYLSRLVDRADLGDLAGLELGYFPFIVIGLALMRMVQSTLTSFTTKLRTEQTTGTLEVLLSTRARPSQVILASASYEVLRATGTGLVMVALAVAGGMRFDATPASVASALVALPALMVLFAALGIAVAAFTVVFKQAQALLGLVTTGLALISGVYFPVEVLPGPVEAVANLVPFTWGLDVVRGALLQATVRGDRLALLLGSAVVTLPLAMIVFGRALDRARRSGSLGHY